MFRFFGGVTEILMPDNLKSAVTHAGKNTVLNRTYAEMAKHYGVVIYPARVRKPQDKSKAELGVLLVSRWILARIRHRQFFGIEELNTTIAEMLKQLNEKPFKKLQGCRRSRFLDMDKPLLTPLPPEEFEYAEWIANRKVTADYHMNVDNHYYSVPHELVSERVETRVSKNVIEFIHRGRRVASHPRSYVEGGHTTISAHQPKAHRAYANLTPEKMIEWAEQIGDASLAAVQYQFKSRPHALLGVRSCSTLKQLAKEYGSERFEAACLRAQRIGSLSIKSIKSILKRRLVDFSDENMPIQTNLPFHKNVRGSDYYNTRSSS
jgi:transposase